MGYHAEMLNIASIVLGVIVRGSIPYHRFWLKLAELDKCPPSGPTLDVYRWLKRRQFIHEYKKRIAKTDKRLPGSFSVVKYCCLTASGVNYLNGLQVSMSKNVCKCECVCDEKPPAGAELEREETSLLTEKF